MFYSSCLGNNTHSTHMDKYILLAKCTEVESLIMINKAINSLAPKVRH